MFVDEIVDHKDELLGKLKVETNYTIHSMSFNCLMINNRTIFSGRYDLMTDEINNNVITTKIMTIYSRIPRGIFWK